jgi:hypothetical protein
VRQQIDDLLNGDIELDAREHDSDLIRALRAHTRAVRALASALDEVKAQLETFNTRLAMVLIGISVTVLSSAILFALRTG